RRACSFPRSCVETPVPDALRPECEPCRTAALWARAAERRNVGSHAGAWEPGSGEEPVVLGSPAPADMPIPFFLFVTFCVFCGYSSFFFPPDHGTTRRIGFRHTRQRGRLARRKPGSDHDRSVEYARCLPSGERNSYNGTVVAGGSFVSAGKPWNSAGRS